MHCHCGTNNRAPIIFGGEQFYIDYLIEKLRGHLYQRWSDELLSDGEYKPDIRGLFGKYVDKAHA